VRLWGGLLLIGCLAGDANARLMNVPTADEEIPGAAISRPDTSRKSSKTEGPSSLKEKDRSEVTSISQEEKEDAAPVFLDTTDGSSSGGGVRLLDPKYLTPNIPPSPEPSWWERWWSGIKALFSGE